MYWRSMVQYVVSLEGYKDATNPRHYKNTKEKTDRFDVINKKNW